MRRFTALLSVFAAGGLSAQSSERSVDPGMTSAQVVERLGKPAAQRTSHGLTVLYYANGCERRCGMPDIVFLKHDAVVDAIFRSSERRYTGASSSAYAIPPASARAGRATVSIGEPIRVRAKLPPIMAEPARAEDTP